MNRRSLLVGIGLGLVNAGCLGRGPAGTPTSSPTPDSPSPTPISPPPSPDSPSTPPPTPRAVEFAVTAVSCGMGTNAAAVSLGAAAVMIDGTIGGRDTCDTAEFAGMRWSDDTLTVRVKTVRRQTTDTVACAQCITDIQYSATIPVGDRTVAAVTVIHETHDGTVTVTTARP